MKKPNIPLEAEQQQKYEVTPASPPIPNATIPLIPTRTDADGGAKSGFGDKTAKTISTMQMQYALRLHQYVLDQIKFADQKAGFSFALNTALLVAIHKATMSQFFAAGVDVSWNLRTIMTLLGFASLVFGGIASFFAIRPRLNPKKPEGLIFWESVANYPDAARYVNAVMDLNEQKLVHEILDHHFYLSRVCSSKYHWLSMSIWGTGIGAIISIALLAFTAIP